MGNRKERRAQGSSQAITSASDIPSMRPSDDPRNSKKPAKTLLDIAAERQAIQSHLPAGPTLRESNVVNVTIDDDGNVRTLDGSPLPNGLSSTTQDGKVVAQTGSDGIVTEEDGVAEIPPIMDTLLLSLPLSAVHFTLAVLTMHQYAQELRMLPLLWDTIFIAFPTLTLLVHLFRGHVLPVRVSDGVRTAVLVLRSLVYLAVANAAGCYLLMLTNDRGYYAVMKKAPAVGTVWVWAVLEMGLVGAVAGVAGPAAFAWWRGYGL
ncbi:uncharacterized protein HMPREF1541_03806 [Cyphellophora europaea CBS 101466]|uniref:DUF7719 domain-containing protein n=1 Tax=Cyphellophora europaea (strain CBS 101466) TaxID=1220924 RepID=W2RZM2_CYPE1|nr:uncharacterized protein HMPREF1541_03806 [Cyphellophora europaea CBS 101466]ETN41867.1 hypothetical protein HMPREF1541_03806 [Cyphellophora europaea CBS 101466]